MQFDNGGNKDVSARVIQFYVPCWLDSAGCPLLKYRLVAVENRGHKKLKSDKSWPVIHLTPFLCCLVFACCAVQ